MNELLKAIRIEYWWQAVLLIGVALCAAAILTDINFLSPKYLFSLGLGCIFIGIGFWMSKKNRFYNAKEGLYQWPVFEHNKLTKTIITVGVVLCSISIISIVYMLFRDDFTNFFH